MSWKQLVAYAQECFKYNRDRNRKVMHIGDADCFISKRKNIITESSSGYKDFSDLHSGVYLCGVSFYTKICHVFVMHCIACNTILVYDSAYAEIQRYTPEYCESIQVWKFVLKCE